jgi:hypothetical protein
MATAWGTSAFAQSVSLGSASSTGDVASGMATLTVPVNFANSATPDVANVQMQIRYDSALLTPNASFMTDCESGVPAPHNGSAFTGCTNPSAGVIVLTVNDNFSGTLLGATENFGSITFDVDANACGGGTTNVATTLAVPTVPDAAATPPVAAGDVLQMFDGFSTNEVCGNTTAACSATNSSSTIDCAPVVGPQPAYSSTPPPGGTINAGSALVGGTTSATLQVTETGDADLVVSAGTIGGANAGDFTVAPTAFTITNGGAAQTVTVSCTPSALGALAGTLTFTTNDPAQPTVSYTLACTGVDATPVGPFPLITVDPAGGFLSAAGDITITVTNQDLAGVGEATQDLLFTAIPDATFLTSDDGSFTFTSTTCGASVAAGASCAIVISYDPAADGNTGDFDQGTYLVDYSNATDETVNLSGGIIPIPTLSEWAMMIMATLMLLFGAVTLRRNGYLG